MEHAADFSGERLELRQRVVEGVALVDDAVQSGFDGDFDLLLENFGLPLFVARVVSGAAALRAGQVVVIQADFADGDDLGMFGEFAQGGAQVGRRFHRLGRMPADGGINGRKFFGQPDGAFAAARGWCRWKSFWRCRRPGRGR